MEPKKIVPPYQVEGYEHTGSYSDEDDADLQVFGQLIDMGSDLNNPRHTIHYFYFESQASATSAAEELRSVGFEVDCGGLIPEEPAARRWPVTADRVEVISLESMRALRQPFREIAGRNGGEYDGWEAQAG